MNKIIFGIWGILVSSSIPAESSQSLAFKALSMNQGVKEPSNTSFDDHPITFANLKWIVREGFGGPGPNQWSNQNVWVDSKGWLHLKIRQVNGKWTCAELYTTDLFSYGQYWFYIIGQIDQLDPNVNVGLFTYIPENTAQPESNEIDIEFTKWGVNSPKSSNITYTVWPNVTEVNKTALTSTLKLNGNYSTHGFIWHTNRIFFQSSSGHHENYLYPIVSWLFSPPLPLKSIPQRQLKVHINLWLINGTPPKDGKDVEIIIKNFCYKSTLGQSNCNNR